MNDIIIKNRKSLDFLDYESIMHPEDKETIDWLQKLKVPYYSMTDFIKELAKHPFDKSFRERLQQWMAIFNAGPEYYTFNDFLAATTTKYREACSEIEYQGEGFNVTPDSIPKMYEQLVEVCRILGSKDVPSYSTDWYYGPYSTSNGEQHRRIIMMSGSVDLMTDDEMLFMLGHEMGHHLCGHKPFHMLVECFYMPIMDDPAFKAWASIIRMPLLDWYRKSDYTADRMGLLCCQDLRVALSTMIKKAGLPKSHYTEINIDGFIEQAKEFEELHTGNWDTIIKTLSLRSAESPWLVVRAARLLEWVESGEYESIINRN